MLSRRYLLGAIPALTVATALAASKTLRVGFQKGEPTLLAAKQNHSFETLLNPLDIDVQWIEFQFSPPMLEAMRVDAIDIGAVGDTPPAFAQEAHGDLLYIAAQRSGGQAILVPSGSTLQTHPGQRAARSIRRRRSILARRMVGRAVDQHRGQCLARFDGFRHWRRYRLRARHDERTVVSQ